MRGEGKKEGRKQGRERKRKQENSLCVILARHLPKQEQHLGLDYYSRRLFFNLLALTKESLQTEEFENMMYSGVVFISKNINQLYEKPTVKLELDGLDTL